MPNHAEFCSECGSPWRVPYGRIRIEEATADDLYWALYMYTSAKIHEKIVVRDSGGDVEPFRRQLKNLARINDELYRLYVEQGWNWPGRRKKDEREHREPAP